jgi:hypothetical protein
LSLGTGVLSWTPGKAQASKRFRTSSTSRMLDVRGRLCCVCNATLLLPPSEAAAPPYTHTHTHTHTHTTGIHTHRHTHRHRHTDTTEDVNPLGDLRNTFIVPGVDRLGAVRLMRQVGWTCIEAMVWPSKQTIAGRTWSSRMGW